MELSAICNLCSKVQKKDDLQVKIISVLNRPLIIIPDLGIRDYVSMRV